MAGSGGSWSIQVHQFGIPNTLGHYAHIYLELIAPDGTVVDQINGQPAPDINDPQNSPGALGIALGLFGIARSLSR